MKYILIILLISITPLSADNNINDIIIDSQMTFAESIKGTKATQNIINDLELLDVQYFSFDGKLHQGQLVIHKALKQDIIDIFKLMRKDKFPIAKCIPIVKYNWSDDASMADNNTSMFNYRKIYKKKTLSNHSYGRAIDINPFQNPAVYKSGRVSPKGATYDTKSKGTLTSTHTITNLLKKRGWRWGGDWNSLKDYQHFDNMEKK